MSCSPARMAANRQNSLKSTGPRSVAGKEVSRLNAFRHGLTGAGDLLQRDEDADLVAERASSFVAELGAPGAVGRLLAHRAAVLSVRMERSADREFAVIASNVATARHDFDRDGLEAQDEWMEILDGPDDPRAALAGLAATPAGLARLTGAWTRLREAIGAADPAVAAAAGSRATVWLGLAPRLAGAVGTPADLADRVDAELVRLRLLAGSNGAIEAAINARRDEVGMIASFDPSPEASLARRYEAAAERGMYRAIRAIAEIRRARSAEVLAGEPQLPPPTTSFAPPGPPARPPAPPRPTPEPLGSFRAEVLATAGPLSRSIVSTLQPALLPAEQARKRPDLRKFHSNRR